MNAPGLPTPVVVNGHPTDLPHRVCARCVQDTSVPGIRFDAAGVCNFCALHDELARTFPKGVAGRAALARMADGIRKRGKNDAFDCVVGVSGGRDSTWLLWCAVKEWGLRPLAVHFNDGFDNPVAGENMVRACDRLGVELRTVTSDWREGKDLKLAFLEASVPDLNLGTDIGIASSLYGVATKAGVRSILIGQSFRTEGIKPLSWSFFDGDYLRAVHARFGRVPLRPWEPERPGFHLGLKELAWYALRQRIRVHTPLYFADYVRSEAEAVIKGELGWVYPGAHYFDDLYHSLLKWVHRVKFNIDLNMNSDSALVREGQMSRDAALARAHGVYAIEDPKVIDLCIKRLGLTRADMDRILALPPKTFRDYPTSRPTMERLKPAIWAASRAGLIPRVTYDKYFRCGE